MLLVHTGDLHLGKSLHERELRDEQEAMLTALADLVAARRPAALLLAGDLYDRAIPSPEAIGLFDSFLTRVVEEAPGLAIVAIPGNHDSATRLAFGAGLFRRAGLHLRPKAADSIEPVLVEAVDPATGALERCAIWALPFLGGGADLGDGAGPGALRGQAELFEAAVGRIRPRLLADAWNVLLAHCFARGGSPSESERGFVGLAEEVDATLFDPFDYAALGHLHRPQAAGKRGRYPGSPLAYSFGEAATSTGGEPTRGFLLVELGPEGARAELVGHRPLRRLVRVEGSFAELTAPGAFAEFRGDLVEARLDDAEPVLDPAERLKANFPNLLSVRQSAFEIRLSGAEAASPALREGGDPEDPARLLEDFALFHREMRGGEEAEAATVELLSTLVGEAAREAG